MSLLLETVMTARMTVSMLELSQLLAFRCRITDACSELPSDWVAMLLHSLCIVMYNPYCYIMIYYIMVRYDYFCSVLGADTAF